MGHLNFDIRKVAWARYREMTPKTIQELWLDNQSVDNIRLKKISVKGLSDLAEVNLGVLLGFRTKDGLHVRFKSKYENRDLFVRTSARLEWARRTNQKISIGGSYRPDGKFFAVFCRIGDRKYNFLKDAQNEKLPEKREALARMPRISMEEALNRNGSDQTTVRITGHVYGISGLGSDYSYVLLGFTLGNGKKKAPTLDVVFKGNEVERHKLIDINCDLDWARENKIPIEIGGYFGGGYFTAVYFKINRLKNKVKHGELITLH
ncbi:hypothetical protein KAH55_03510 [bacterium]|nr:hypothetical protein [bacterium]